MEVRCVDVVVDISESETHVESTGSMGDLIQSVKSTSERSRSLVMSVVRRKSWGDMDGFELLRVRPALRRNFRRVGDDSVGLKLHAIMDFFTRVCRRVMEGGSERERVG